MVTKEGVLSRDGAVTSGRGSDGLSDFATTALGAQSDSSSPTPEHTPEFLDAGTHTDASVIHTGIPRRATEFLDTETIDGIHRRNSSSRGIPSMDSGGSNSSTRIPRRDTAPSSLNSSIVHTPAEFLTEFLDARRHWTPVSVAAPFLYLLFFQMFILVYFQDNFEQRGMKPLGFFHASLLAGNAILSPFVVHGFCCAFWGTLARKKLIVQDKVQDPKQHEVAAKYTSFVCLLWFLCYAFVPMFSVFLQGNRVICFACPKRYRLSCHTLTLALLGQYTTATQPHRRCTVHDMNNISVGLVYDVAVCVCVHDDVDDSTGAVYMTPLRLDSSFS